MVVRSLASGVGFSVHDYPTSHVGLCRGWWRARISAHIYTYIYNNNNINILVKNAGVPKLPIYSSNCEGKNSSVTPCSICYQRSDALKSNALLQSRKEKVYMYTHTQPTPIFHTNVCVAGVNTDDGQQDFSHLDGQTGGEWSHSAHAYTTVHTLGAKLCLLMLQLVKPYVLTQKKHHHKERTLLKMRLPPLRRGLKAQLVQDSLISRALACRRCVWVGVFLSDVTMIPK